MEKAWILINPAIREGLPNSYLEAAAHRTAILSHVDPDGFASQFGYHVSGNNFEEGLSTLLHGNAWQNKAARGVEYVSANFNLPHAMNLHEAVYLKLK
jgi:hypothetical protein